MSQTAYDREIRTGIHLLKTAKSLGWKDGGEGAFEFVVRRSREVALEDCAARIEVLEAALRRAYGFLQDKSFIPDSLTHECTKVLEEMEAALAPEQDK